MDRLAISDRGAEADAANLARLASRAYQDAVAFYREQGHAPDAADRMAREPHWHTLDAPAHEVSWFGLETLLNADPPQAIAVWQRITREATGYVESGQYAAEALRYRSPWERAQFLAVRAALYDGWQPQNGVERILLDTIAHAQCVYLHWAGEVQQRATTDASDTDKERRKAGYWVPPRVSEAEALHSAAAMADRFNRLMVRTLRALRDLRRSGVVVVAQPGSQVNIGQQQVNMNKQETRE